MYTHPFRSFLISDFVLQDMKKIFCQNYQNYFRNLWLKFFIFQMSGRWFPWQPKGGMVYTPLNLEVFSDILATAGRLNTLYELETFYVQLSRHISYCTNFEAYLTFDVFIYQCQIFTFCSFWLRQYRKVCGHF